MKTASGTAFIHNGQLVDGTGAPPVKDAALVIEDGRIHFAGRAALAPVVTPQATRIDVRGGTIMPGLVEAHFHATYFNVAALEDLDIKYPVEFVTLLAARMRSWHSSAATLRPAVAEACSTLTCGSRRPSKTI